ncbi:unnamed protein product [Pleuronectes platessa]|uniref:Uncharacterized protein n=1 Tax=Pleuronectes platessa TaxID=8262 RepID=A0A9N7U3W1_PLEPL|nr:unnamed protein product [Pleuronectes platessa]
MFSVSALKKTPALVSDVQRAEHQWRCSAMVRQIARGADVFGAIDLLHQIRTPSDRLLTSSGRSMNPSLNILLLLSLLPTPRLEGNQTCSSAHMTPPSHVERLSEEDMKLFTVRFLEQEILPAWSLCMSE